VKCRQRIQSFCFFGIAVIFFYISYKIGGFYTWPVGRINGSSGPLAYVISHNLIGLGYGLLIGADLLVSSITSKGKWRIDFLRLAEALLVIVALVALDTSLKDELEPLRAAFPGTVWADPSVFLMFTALGVYVPNLLCKEDQSVSREKKGVCKAIDFTLFLFLMGILLVYTGYLQAHESVTISLVFMDRWAYLAAGLPGLLIGLQYLLKAVQNSGKWRVDPIRFITAAFMGLLLIPAQEKGAFGYGNFINDYCLVLLIVYTAVHCLFNKSEAADT
jgi:hypothetical protein